MNEINSTENTKTKELLYCVPLYSMVDFLYVIVLVITSTNATVRVLDGNGKSTSLLPSSKVARRPKPQFLRQSSPSTEKTRPLAAAGDGTGIVLTIIPGRQRLSAECRTRTWQRAGNAYQDIYNRNVSNECIGRPSQAQKYSFRSSFFWN